MKEARARISLPISLWHIDLSIDVSERALQRVSLGGCLASLTYSHTMDISIETLTWKLLSGVLGGPEALPMNMSIGTLTWKLLSRVLEAQRHSKADSN